MVEVSVVELVNQTVLVKLVVWITVRLTLSVIVVVAFPHTDVTV